MQSAGGFDDSELNPDVFLPYSINDYEAVELVSEVFAASPLTQNNERRSNENE